MQRGTPALAEKGTRLTGLHVWQIFLNPAGAVSVAPIFHYVRGVVNPRESDAKNESWGLEALLKYRAANADAQLDGKGNRSGRSKRRGPADQRRQQVSQLARTDGTLARELTSVFRTRSPGLRQTRLRAPAWERAPPFFARLDLTGVSGA